MSCLVAHCRHGGRALQFAKQNAEACFNLASDLTNAKDLPEVMVIQARHAQTLMQSYALQAQELSHDERRCRAGSRSSDRRHGFMLPNSRDKHNDTYGSSLNGCYWET
jgi:hypothetical protein